MRASRLAKATLVLVMSGSALVTAGFIGVQPALAAAPAADVSITNSDVHGNAADDAASAVTFPAPSATVQLALVVSNTGTDNLTGLSVLLSSATPGATGSSNGLTCTFPDSTQGVTWAGPLLPGISFGCVVALTISQSELFGLTATVNATGATTETAVTDSNAYYAFVSPQTTNDPVTTTTAAAVRPRPRPPRSGSTPARPARPLATMD
jgi:hypothetical protein